MRFLLCFLAVSALAQNRPHIGEWRPDADTEALARPKTACAALHSLTGYDLSVMTAETTAAGGETPEFCRVLLLAQPEIRIEVSLPANWNRRLYMFGNGGYAGEDLESAGRVTQRDAALKLGFAVAQTNTGHDAAREPLATFTTNPQKLLDWAFRSLHVTAETAKRTAESYYGIRPRRSYYSGCSTGGRQGLILAQRYPDDFDGIVVGAPSLDYMAGRVRAISTFQELAKAPIPVAKLKVLAERVYAKCDAVDGLKDGLLDDPRRCDFRAARDLPLCAGGDAPNCFTPAQINVLETLYNDLVLNGKRVAPGYPKGAEATGPDGKSGWDGWILREGGLAQSAQFAESALRYMVFPKPDPTYDMTRFELAKDAHRFEWTAKLISPKDPDLSRFRQHGGKLLMYFGWADPALNPLTGIAYYEDVTRTMGESTREFFRLYMMPGVFHCGGGVGPACFDPLARVISWVEQGKAPETIVATQLESGHVVRSRPLCPHPQVARYQGAGSVDDAVNFKCVEAK